MVSNAANWWKGKTDRDPPKTLAQCTLWMKTNFQTVSQSLSLLFLQLGLCNTILKQFQLIQSKRGSHLHIFIKAIYCHLTWQPFTKSAPTKVLNRIKNISYRNKSAKTRKDQNSREPDVYSVYIYLNSQRSWNLELDHNITVYACFQLFRFIRLIIRKKNMNTQGTRGSN